MGKKTALYERHLELGARMVEFGGWDMPVQYTGIIDEHKTVREKAGLFDVSHMGEVFVSGGDALAFLQSIVPQDISKLALHKAVYCQLPYENGGLVDDLIIYKLEENKYLIIVNASNILKDYEWFLKNKKDFDVNIDNKSDIYSMVALQGPLAFKILEKCGIDEAQLPEFFTIKNSVIDGIELFLSRTGYTGEDGFELIAKNEDILKLWNLLLDNGKDFGLKPVGLGARDTLRMEAALMLYGNDLDEHTTPVEAGLKWSIPVDKVEDYNGKDVILGQIKNGVSKKLIGLEMIDRAVPRHGYELYFNNQKTGIVTSGGYSPTLDKNIAMGYVDKINDIKLDSTIQVMVRNKLYNAKVVKRPFVHKNYKK